MMGRTKFFPFKGMIQIYTYYFLSHPSGQNQATWPNLPAKKAENCGLLLSGHMQKQKLIMMKKKGTMNRYYKSTVVNIKKKKKAKISPHL